jgi:hypothetical protein
MNKKAILVVGLSMLCSHSVNPRRVRLDADGACPVEFVSLNTPVAFPLTGRMVSGVDSLPRVDSDCFQRLRE